MPDRSQDATVVDLFHLADAAGLNSVQKPANEFGLEDKQNVHLL